MNILFVIKKDVYSSVEPLGILYLSSVLKAHGHGVFLSDSSLDKIGRLVKEKNIGIFAISCMNTDYKYYLSISEEFKKKFPKIPVIWGGPTPTYNPEIINQSAIDIICRGEGEIALLELLNRLDSKQDYKKIPNLWVKKKSVIYKNAVGPFITDLNSLPFPDHSLLGSLPQFKYSPIKIIMAGRGCPFNCSFCFNHKFHELYRGKGKMIRTRDVSNVIEELEKLKREYDTQFFYFMDDVFPFEHSWLTAFVREYSRKIKIPFTIVTSAVFIDDFFARQIRKAGCVSVHLAIECGDEKLRREVLNKPVSNKQIINACKILKRQGISISAYNMIGIPFSDFEDELKTLDLNLKAKVDAAYVSFCLPFIDTQMGKKALDAGLISKDTEFLSWFERIPIQVENREKVEKFAHLFTLILMFPSLRKYLSFLLKLPIPQSFLKLLKDLLNGYSLKKKIIPVKISYMEFLVTSFYFLSKRFTK